MPERSGMHPALLIGGLVLVAVIVYAVAQNKSASDAQTITFANTPGGSDVANQNAAAIAQSAIAAGAQNVQTAAELIGLENTNATSVINTDTTTAAQLQAEEVQAATQLETARVTSATQQAITDSNNRLAAQVAAGQQATAQAQVAAQRQATTDSVITSIANDAAKVLSVLTLGFL